MKIAELFNASRYAPAGARWHGGPGYYYCERSNPRNGSCGPFLTEGQAKGHAIRNGFVFRLIESQEDFEAANAVNEPETFAILQSTPMPRNEAA